MQCVGAIVALLLCSMDFVTYEKYLRCICLVMLPLFLFEIHVGFSSSSSNGYIGTDLQSVGFSNMGMFICGESMKPNGVEFGVGDIISVYINRASGHTN